MTAQLPADVARSLRCRLDLSSRTWTGLASLILSCEHHGSVAEWDTSGGRIRFEAVRLAALQHIARFLGTAQTPALPAHSPARDTRGPVRPRLSELIDEDEAFRALHTLTQLEQAAIAGELESLLTFAPSSAEDPLDVLGPVLERLRGATGRPETRVETGPGWHRLTAELDRRLAEIDPHYSLQQVTESFARLRVSALPSRDDDLTALDRFRDLTRSARAASTWLCEVCGRAGRLRDQRPPGRLRTLCDTHEHWR